MTTALITAAAAHAAAARTTTQSEVTGSVSSLSTVDLSRSSRQGILRETNHQRAQQRQAQARQDLIANAKAAPGKVGSANVDNIAIGSAQPTQIVEGRTYASFAQFFSYNNNAVVGQRAHHAVSIDSRLEFTAACIAGLFSDAFCFFSVDASRVSDRIPFS